MSQFTEQFGLAAQVEVLKVTLDKDVAEIDGLNRQVGELTERVAYLQNEAAEARQHMAIAVGERNAVQGALTGFKADVRKAAIIAQQGHSGHLSVEALNVWLVDLGLDPHVPKYVCEGTWRGVELPGATVAAEDEGEAERKYREALANGALSIMLNLSGDLTDTDDVVFDSNSVDESTDEDVSDEFDVDDVEVEVEEED